MDISAFFSGAIEALKRRFGLFALIALFPAAIALVVIGGGWVLAVVSAIAATSSSRTFPAGLIVAFAIITVGVFATLLAQLKSQAMLSLGAYEIAQGLRPDFRGLLARTRGFLPRMAPVIGIFVGAIVVIYALVFGIAFAMVGALDGRGGGAAAGVAGLLILLILALVPLAFFIQVKLLYLVPATAIEQLGGIDGMKRSWNLTKGAFWRTFGYYIIAALAVSAVSYAVSLIAQVGMLPVLTTVQDSTSSSPAQVAAMLAGLIPLYILMIVLQLAVQVFAQPFLHSYITYMFVDQVRRSEMPPPAPYGYGAYYQPGTPQPPQGWQPQPPQTGWQQPQPPQPPQAPPPA